MATNLTFFWVLLTEHCEVQVRPVATKDRRTRDDKTHACCSLSPACLPWPGTPRVLYFFVLPSCFTFKLLCHLFQKKSAPAAKIYAQSNCSTSCAASCCPCRQCTCVWLRQQSRCLHVQGAVDATSCTIFS